MQRPVHPGSFSGAGIQWVPPWKLLFRATTGENGQFAAPLPIAALAGRVEVSSQGFRDPGKGPMVFRGHGRQHRRQPDLWPDADPRPGPRPRSGSNWGPAEHVGLLVPPTVPAAVANLAVTLWGKIPGQPQLLGQPKPGGLLDRPVRDHARLDLGQGARSVQDHSQGALDPARGYPQQVRLTDKLWAAAVAKLVPIGAWVLRAGLRDDNLDATATVIFTSGSTGDPKGVVLSHRNILSNVHQVEEQVHLKPDEVLLGILPFFHSFGFTITIWTAMCLGKKVVYHFNPLDARTIGKLCEQHKVTLLTAPPVHAVLLEELRAAAVPDDHPLILGAEKLKPELARDIQDARHRAARGLWLHRAVAGRRGERAARGRAAGWPRVHGNRLGTVGSRCPAPRSRRSIPTPGPTCPREPKG